jgi:Protein of unknown function (DUF1640)
MASVSFDTLKVARKLEQAGFSAQQAEAVAESLKDALTTSEVATKADLREIAAELRAEIAEVRSELRLMKGMLGFILGGIAFILLRLYFPIPPIT